MRTCYSFCGTSLQTGTRIVAFVELAISSIALLYGIFLFGSGLIAVQAVVENKNGSLLSGNGGMRSAIYTLIPFLPTQDMDQPFGNLIVGFVGLVLMLISMVVLDVSVISLIVSIVLLKGARQKDLGKCRFWLINQWVVLICMVGRLLYQVIRGEVKRSYEYGGAYIYLFVKVYFMMVVSAFIAEQEEQLKVQEELKEQELKEIEFKEQLREQVLKELDKFKV